MYNSIVKTIDIVKYNFNFLDHGTLFAKTDLKCLKTYC